MHVGSDHAAAVRDIILQAWPDRFDVAQLDGDAPLGAAGVGLDSVEIVELILASEVLFERRCDQRLFEDPPLTIHRLANHLADA